MTTYLKFINPFKRYPAYLVATGICTLFYVIFNTLSIWLVAPVLKVIFMPGKSDAAPVPLTTGMEGWYESFKNFSWDIIGGSSDPLTALPRLVTALIIVFLLKNLFAYGQMYFVSFVEQRMVRDLRDHVFGHVAKLPYSYFDQRSTGQLMSSVMNDVYTVSLMFQRVFTQAIRDPLTVITLLVVLFSISWELTLMAALIVPLFGLIYRYTGKSLKRKSARIQAQLGEITSHLQEAISGSRLVKSFGSEEHEIGRFQKKSDDLFRHGLRLARLDRLASPLSETIGVVIISLVLLFGGQKVLSGSLLDAEDFIRFIVVLFSILSPIRGVGGIFNNLNIGQAAGARIEQILENPVEPLTSEGKAKNSFDKEISFEHIWFRYATKPDWILQDVSLAIQKNERIALVGRSGSGKTTLANLIPRFYEIEKGEIRIDDVSTKDLTLHSLRNLISIVSQDVFLFNDTARNNICYGLKQVDEKRLAEVIEKSHAAEFIKQLPNGLDSIVGERGTQLSGGQKQRIAIARALLRNAPILIFDEATSALDAESERYIQKALDELFHQRTVIMIAHRLSSIRTADRIVVMDKGQISAIGKHNELLEKSPLYLHLTKLYDTGEDA